MRVSEVGHGRTERDGWELLVGDGDGAEGGARVGPGLEMVDRDTVGWRQ